MTPLNSIQGAVTRVFQCFLLLLGTWGGTAQAALIGAVPGVPDIQSTNMSLTYDAGTTTLTIEDTVSTSYTLLKNGVTSSLAADDYSLTASIDSSGNFSGGSLLILNGTDTLLDATVDAFGWQFISGPPGVPTTGKFDAIFTVNQADPILGFGSEGVMLASFDLEFPGIDLAAPWAASFASQADLAFVDTAGPHSVPVPSTLSLLIVAAFGVIRFRRRRR